MLGFLEAEPEKAVGACDLQKESSQVKGAVGTKIGQGKKLSTDVN